MNVVFHYTNAPQDCLFLSIYEYNTFVFAISAVSTAAVVIVVVVVVVVVYLYVPEQKTFYAVSLTVRIT